MRQLFKSENSYQIYEQHGGVNVPHEIWTYLGFYEDGRATLYYSGDNSISGYFHFDRRDFKGFYKLRIDFR